ncbi:hypothetical protein PAHAL_5G506700 [Panicum hallii]|uniref:Embryo surrounding factor 1 brassicaceae domain-containing protein n=1 Tax=Panicum hallii TaxID=206008 RepID=A0A2T8IP63_9POAL|nr:hypothetical protein PAHAL_5G506700 [Panicum hallii]
MNASNVLTALFLLIAMLFGSPADASRSSSIAVAATTSKPLEASKVTLIFCAVSKCNFFSPSYDLCYCCPDASRREHCHLSMEECRANCASCKPKCLS